MQDMISPKSFCDFGLIFLNSLLFCLVLVGPDPPGSAFLVSSSRGLGLEVISQVTQKGKGRLSGLLVLCLSPQCEPLPLFYLSSSAG
jgi:hypothetical protein